MKTISKVLIVLGLPMILSANGVDMDAFFDGTSDVTESVITDIKLKRQVNIDRVEKERKRVKIITKENTPPKVYFKQPRIYTIYTRDEIRNFGNIDMILNNGWKTIVVGQHQLVVNDEFKNK